MGSKGRQRIRIGRRTRKGNRGRVEWMGKKSNEKSSEEPWKDGVGKVEVVVVTEEMGVGVGKIACP